ncbi:MAG: hypothetical protein OXG68_13585 [Chloroflexi bacterium]|nr:hypothetical protein [Chloroflexota bacterium]
MTPDEHKTATHLLDKNKAADATLDESEPTEEDIRSSIRRSMRQAIAGETRPADEALEEIRRELVSYADARQDH